MSLARALAAAEEAALAAAAAGLLTPADAASLEARAVPLQCLSSTSGACLPVLESERALLLDGVDSAVLEVEGWAPALWPEVLTATWGGVLPHGRRRLALASPADGCAAAATDASVPGALLIARRGNCSFADKVQAAQQAGAAALLVVDSDAAAPLQRIGAPDSAELAAPAMLVRAAVGARLIEAAEAAAAADVAAAAAGAPLTAIYATIRPAPGGAAEWLEISQVPAQPQRSMRAGLRLRAGTHPNLGRLGVGGKRVACDC